MFFLISLLFNFILNIPIDLNYLGIGVGFRQRVRTFSESSNRRRPEGSGSVLNGEAELNEASNRPNEEDKISVANLQAVLTICAQVLNTRHGNGVNQVLTTSSSSDNNVGSSTDQINPNANSGACGDIRKRNTESIVDESGDAH